MTIQDIWFTVLFIVLGILMLIGHLPGRAVNPYELNKFRD